MASDKLFLFFPVLIFLSQIIPNDFLIISGILCTVVGRIKKLSFFILFGCMAIGHWIWILFSGFLESIVTNEYWLDILDRFGLAGYIALFLIWDHFQPIDNRYFHWGNLKGSLHFPLIWSGYKEPLWRFSLVFFVICSGTAFFLYFTKPINYITILYGLLFTVINAILEEFIWRGFVLGKLVDSVGEKQALILSALAFGFYHISLDFTIGACLIFSIGGFYMGGSAIKSRGLFIPILMHILVNIIFVFAGIIF